MKNIKVILAILIMSINTNSILAQCSVEQFVSEDGTKSYTHMYEKLYTNEDFENGILMAMAQIIVVQSPDNPELLQFVLKILVGNKPRKQMVVPRKLNIYFNDGSSLNLDAESLVRPKESNGVDIEQSMFRLNSAIYLQLGKKSISKITISDHRENRRLDCYPYKNTLLEQVKCISTEISKTLLR